MEIYTNYLESIYKTSFKPDLYEDYKKKEIFMKN